MAPVQKEIEPLRLTLTPLVMDERNELARIFATPAFIKAFRNARCVKPTAFAKECNAALGLQIASNRLHEIRGWEAFEFALLAQADEPKVKPTRIEENFPAAGTIDAAFEEEAKRNARK